MLTESQRKALEIVRDHPGIAPREFANLMWADSPGHRRHTKCGYGTTTGGGMNLAGGGYLGKLAKKGYVYRFTSIAMCGQYGYRISDEGKAALARIEK